MSRTPPASPQLRTLLEAGERAMRQLADACFGAWDKIVTGGPGSSRLANGIMDCSYVASTSARLVAHSDDYQLHMIAMQIGVCRRVAARCASACERDDDKTLAACAHAARACERACNDVLALLWDGRLAAIGAAADEDEPISASAVR